MTKRQVMDKQNSNTICARDICDVKQKPCTASQQRILEKTTCGRESMASATDNDLPERIIEHEALKDEI